MATEPVTIDLQEHTITEGAPLRLRATGADASQYRWSVASAPTEEARKLANGLIDQASVRETLLETAGLPAGRFVIRVIRTDATEHGGEVTTESEAEIRIEPAINATVDAAVGIRSALEQVVSGGLSLKPRASSPTGDQAFWVKLRECAGKRKFDRYDAFIRTVLCDDGPSPDPATGSPCQHLDRKDDCFYQHGVHAYKLLLAATDCFLLCHACCGDMGEIQQFDEQGEALRLGYQTTRVEMNQQLGQYLKDSVSPRTLPYLDRILRNLNLMDHATIGYPFCPNTVRSHLCMYELIWSYWLEEGMLVQTMNALSLRFQNRRVPGKNALANFDLDPLRPLSNFLWGYIQDEGDRLTVKRRAYEYEHQYGLTLVGKAVGETHVADRRNRFLEAFHSLLHRCSLFFRDKRNTMIEPDTTALLEPLRDVHLLLSEGGGNQWGDAAIESRKEMMLQQWLMSLKPMQEVFRGRPMVAYDERWMGSVDQARQQLSLGTTSIMHFHRLASVGELILLSIRFGHWNSGDVQSEQAGNWASYFQNEINQYIAAYRTVTGVDLSADTQRIAAVDATQPSVLLQRASQRKPA